MDILELTGCAKQIIAPKNRVCKDLGYENAAGVGIEDDEDDDKAVRRCKT